MHLEHVALGNRPPRDEEDRRRAQPLQDRQRELVLAAETIVEGEDTGSVGENTFAVDRSDELVPADELMALGECGDLRCELRGRHREDGARLLGLVLGDVVVADGQQHQREDRLTRSGGRDRCRPR